MSNRSSRSSNIENETFSYQSDNIPNIVDEIDTTENLVTSRSVPPQEIQTENPILSLSHPFPSYNDLQELQRPDDVAIEVSGPIDDADSALERRRQIMNTLWGFKPYKGHITKRDIHERSEIVKDLHKPVAGWEAIKRSKKRNRMIGIGNIIYVFLFGWWFSLIYFIVGIIACLTIIEIPYGKKCLELCTYYFWPFGKYLEVVNLNSVEGNSLISRENRQSTLTEDVTLQPPHDDEQVYNDENLLQFQATTSVFNRFFVNRSGSNRTILEWIQFVLFLIFFAPILLITHLVCMTMSWLTIFFIPVAKVSFQGAKVILKDPLKVDIDDRYPPSPNADVVLCTYQAFNIFYYKYSVSGMNIILVNLLPFVLFTLVLSYCFGEAFVEKYAVFIFPLCLLSTVPLAYYIGKAVSSISAQTSFALGAILNALFGTIIQLILYFLALYRGKRSLVTNSVTGNLIGAMLLCPGLAMILGGLKHKEQFFNRHAAGVSATLLLMAIIGAFTPSIFYQFYGDYKLDCDQCLPINGTSLISCSRCHSSENHYEEDYVYSHRTKYLMYLCSALLPIGYIVGLVFTLKTHAFLYEKPIGDPDKPETLETPKTHGAPEWSKLRCVIILFFSTIIFAFIAEAMISAMSPALEIFHIDERFAGLTLIAVVPSISEYINAVAFGLQNNIVLSLEIGSVSAIQTALLQMPLLVIVSAILGFFGIYEGENSIFTLIFPNMNLYTVMFSVLIITYITMNGRSNYFEGFILVVSYIIIVATFFFIYQDL